MNKYSVTLFVLIVFVIVAGIGVVLFYDEPTQPEQPDGQINLPEVITSEVDTNDWQVYTNPRFNYSFKHPVDSKIQYSSMDNVSSISVCDREDCFVVISLSNRTQLSDKNLQETVAFLWYLNVTDDNPNTPDRRVSDIESTVFAQRQVYHFSTTVSFKLSDGSWGGSEKESEYFFISNNNDVFMIYYPINHSLSKQIIKTFEFIN